jgi:hypothetical protein
MSSRYRVLSNQNVNPDSTPALRILIPTLSTITQRFRYGHANNADAERATAYVHDASAATGTAGARADGNEYGRSARLASALRFELYGAYCIFFQKSHRKAGSAAESYYLQLWSIQR